MTIDFRDMAMMRALGTLIQCAAKFQRSYAHRHVHLKVFVAAEVLPFLQHRVLLNPLKALQDEVYMHWRPKDLMRLISWRLYCYLQANPGIVALPKNIDWRKHEDVLENLWVPYFGREVINRAGKAEATYPYVLRHTHMRPRQMIYICRLIADNAIAGGNFPAFTRQDIVEGVRIAENKLAAELINSYNEVYPNVERILDALNGISLRFYGKELDRRAKETKAAWPDGAYSLDAFRRLVAELGIVGRVRTCPKEQNTLTADFEYSQVNSLGLLPSDDCVIHPMFNARFSVINAGAYKVYPFPDHPDFLEI